MDCYFCKNVGTKFTNGGIACSICKDVYNLDKHNINDLVLRVITTFMNGKLYSTYIELYSTQIHYNFHTGKTSIFTDYQSISICKMHEMQGEIFNMFNLDKLEKLMAFI